MYWQDALGAAIEVAIAIAGFAGIVTALVGRGGHAFSLAARLQLEVLLTASGIAIAFAFLPFVLFQAGLAGSDCWRIGSAMMVAWMIGIGVFRGLQTRRVGNDGWLQARVLDVIFVVGVAASLLLQLANVLWLTSAWPYMIGVLVMLFIGFSAFVRLLLAARSVADAAEDSD